jgi:phosphatidylglycerophosphate synthase
MAGFLLYALALSAPTDYRPHYAVAMQDQSSSQDNTMVVAENEERGKSDTVVLLVVFVSAGLLLTVLSIPMVFRKIPPNYWYGFRVRATLESEEVWYPANEYAGKRLFWVGIAAVASAFAGFLLPVLTVGVYASLVGVVVVVGLVVTLAQCFLYLRRLSPRK